MAQIASALKSDVFYKETHEFHPDDDGAVSDVFELRNDTAGIKEPIRVVLGKPVRDAHNGLLFFRIYALHKQTDKIRGQIGVFEFVHNPNQPLELQPPYDPNTGTVDAQQLGVPLLYSFLSPSYLAKMDVGLRAHPPGQAKPNSTPPLSPTCNKYCSNTRTS
jgi:hypothetical protein